jgi:hypothetical protein
MTAYNLMTPTLLNDFKDVNFYPSGINIPDKSFDKLNENIYQIPDPNDSKKFILNRTLTKKETRAALYVIVNDDETCFDYPKNMIEVPIYKIVKSITDFSTNVRQDDEKFYKVGYTVADYISIRENTNEKIYHAD